MKSDKDSYDLEQILHAHFPNVATHKWCVIYNELHPTLIRNLVDWIFLAQSLCRGVLACRAQVTNFDKVSVINHCVELVFRPLGTGGKKIYGVLRRDQIIERLNDHNVANTCNDIRGLLTNTKFDTPKHSKKTKTRPFITGQSLAEYIRC